MLMLSQSFASLHFYNHKTKKSKHLSWLNCQSEEMDLQRKFYFRLCAFFHIWVVVSIGALIKVLVFPDVILYQDVVRLCLWSWIGEEEELHLVWVLFVPRWMSDKTFETFWKVVHHRGSVHTNHHSEIEETGAKGQIGQSFREVSRTWAISFHDLHHQQFARGDKYQIRKIKILESWHI